MRSKLKSWLSWQPQPVEFLVLMRPVKPWPVRMSLYSTGIDNTHIDVSLSSSFVDSTRTLVRLMVRQDVAGHYGNWAAGQPTPQDLDAFRVGYRGLMEVAVNQRQRFATVDWVRLLQLSLLKFLLQLVPEQVQALRQHLESERERAEGRESGLSLEFHQRLVVLAREKDAIAYRVSQRLFRLAEQVELTHLRKLRKSLLGSGWPIPGEALFNPLLQMPHLLAEEGLVFHYPMFCIEKESRHYLDGFNQNLCEVFKAYLPTWAQPRVSGTRQSGPEAVKQNAVHRGLQVRERLDQGGLRGFLETEIILSQLLTEEEYKTPQFSWLDDPDNLHLLFSDRPVAGTGVREVAGEERLNRHWSDYRRAVREELIRRIEGLGIMPRIIASYQTLRVYQQLSEQVSARLIYDYLTGQRSKPKVLRQLGAQGGVEPTQVVKNLDFAVAEIKQLNQEKRREYVLRALHDVLRLRRDLKLAYKIFEAMDQIRLLTKNDEIHLSRTNGLLYEFRRKDERTVDKRIRSHVILKADLRGSTRITSELRAKKLNPATHFSQNFFNPINQYLADFKANKVFVEGDAVILSFLEYSNSGERGRSVAYACGMASRILEVVARQNIVNRRHGLPELELGLGISFSDEEPAFLYDGDHKIMISPAINLADRLSSCAKVLRSDEFTADVRPFRVEVLVPAQDADLPAGSKTEVVRYNVNGIELDAEAFSKLKSELPLQRLDVKVGGRGNRFHVGRYPDSEGRLQWLVVRESHMRLWEGGRVSDRQAPGQRFYEVVVEPSVVTLLRSKLRSGGGQRTTGSHKAVGSR